MLIGLKGSSLTSKCAFYRQEHNVKGEPIKLNFEGLKNAKVKYINTQTVDEKMGSFV